MGGGRPVQLLHERGLADPCGAGDQQQLKAPVRRARGRLHEPGHIGGAPIEPLGKTERVGAIRGAQGKERAPSAVSQLSPALLQIGDEPMGALVASVGILGEQHEHDTRQRLWHLWHELSRRGR